jgi:DNA-binding PadR family transcriptional regulator
MKLWIVSESYDLHSENDVKIYRRRDNAQAEFNRRWNEITQKLSLTIDELDKLEDDGTVERLRDRDYQKLWISYEVTGHELLGTESCVTIEMYKANTED